MKLADWLKMTKTRQYVFASKIGVTTSMVSDYVHGRAKPTRPDVIDAIYRLTGGKVTPNDFHDLPQIGDAAQTGAPAQ
jgi:DNA-binding transcriptional regulator YdaS (Cro superfamily)